MVAKRVSLVHLVEKFKQSPKYNTLNKKQIRFCEEVLGGNNVFLTGIAGSGKSYVVQTLFDFLESRGLYVGKTALTGVAALIIGGSTLHSFLGIGLGDEDLDNLIKKVKKNKKARRRIQACKVLIVDEISMMNAELFDKFYGILEYFRGDLPICILTGEFLQLPPVQKFYTGTKLFAFESDSWKKAKIKAIELTEMVRQDANTPFAALLRKIRVGSTKGIELLQSRVGAKLKTDLEPIKIFSKNIDVDRVNEKKYSLIDGPEQIYYATDYGDPKYAEFFNKNCLAPETLKLKVGAQVMLLRNLEGSTLVNGSIGKVVSFAHIGPIVEFENKIREIIGIEEWSVKEQIQGLDGKMTYKKVATRKQIPLKLSWACTIHKTQGATLDFAEIDLSKAWEYGMHYVALSRVRSLEGLSLTDFDPDDIKAHPKCVEFYKNLK